MNSQGYILDAVNTHFALLLSRIGNLTNAGSFFIKNGQHPVILLDVRGLRVVLSANFFDHTIAEKVVSEDIRSLVSNGIAHLAVGVIYPKILREISSAKIIGELEKSNIRYQIVTEFGENNTWLEGTPTTLIAAIFRAQESLVKEDIIKRITKKLNVQLNAIARLWINERGACDRLSYLLEFDRLAGEVYDKAIERRESAAKVAALVLANAFIFQEQLSKSNIDVLTLKSISVKNNLIGSTSEHWRWIWQNVNYVPIFQLGEKVLNELPEGIDSTFAVEALLNEAQSICRKQVSLRHDLMGRIYHWLLHEAKHLGTYYTSTTAATLLLKLVFALEWKHDFSHADIISKFKISDFACGTGTLLMAGAQALTDRFIRERAEQGYSIEAEDIAKLHKTLMQDVMHGYDVLPTAVHLTASTLALLAPEVAFDRMNLFVMPLGLDHDKPRLGSLDFLESADVKTQFALDDTQLESVRSSVTGTDVTNAFVPKLDLCVMNPPFVRSTGGNLLFGSLPQERATLQSALSKKAKSLSVSTTAGLGAMFVPLAKIHTKPGGRIAFILPLALATGEAWAAVREIIANYFQLELVISSHDIERYNFSENTNLSEVLFIARRLDNGEKSKDTIFMKLWRNPRTIHEALDCAARIAAVLKDKNFHKDQIRMIKGLEEQTIGEIIRIATPVGKEIWNAAVFAQGHLYKAHWNLFHEHKVCFPVTNESSDVRLCRLDELGELGYDSRDVMDAFDVDKTAETYSPFAGFWNHDAKKVKTIGQIPNSTLLPREKPLPSRKLKPAEQVWDKSGNTLLVSRIRTNTHRLIATSFEKNVIGNTWWAFNTADISETQRKCLILWLNSTFGVLSLFGQRVVTAGAWMSIKKPAWSSMQVLDVRQVDQQKLNRLENVFDEVANQQLQPVAKLDTDPVRKLIDEAICAELDIPDIISIRQLLAREPSLSAEKIGGLFLNDA